MEGSGKIDGVVSPGVKAEGNQVTVSLFGGETRLEYTVTAPTAEERYAFSGRVRSGPEDPWQTVTGESVVTVETSNGATPPTETTDPMPPVDTGVASASRAFAPDPVSQGGTLDVTVDRQQLRWVWAVGRDDPG